MVGSVDVERVDAAVKEKSEEEEEGSRGRESSLNAVEKENLEAVVLAGEGGSAGDA